MIDLHERLSEFSYGYGVTREIEEHLSGVGLTVTPFLPSLVHENELGFDVAFNKPGVVIMAQFKLGQQMKRFRSSPPGSPAPDLDKPFWRFQINTHEAQYRQLRRAEQRGAEVYYVAPRFSDWAVFDMHFLAGEVLDHSLLIRPAEIAQALVAQGAHDGVHRVVYDRTRKYVCSKPVEIAEVKLGQFVDHVLTRTHVQPEPLIQRLEAILPAPRRRAARLRRFDQPAKPADANLYGRRLAIAIASAAWARGAQTIFVTSDSPPGSPEA
uniref:hypothetical protein n=1 Tax=uncultured Caulobacter sp. TaxID=158749 RepID=UPI0025E0B9E1|nr:hypothetical protein [uncultured Caulobacter sp.]